MCELQRISSLRSLGGYKYTAVMTRAVRVLGGRLFSASEWPSRPNNITHMPSLLTRPRYTLLYLRRCYSLHARGEPLCPKPDLGFIAICKIPDPKCLAFSPPPIRLSHRSLPLLHQLEYVSTSRILIRRIRTRKRRRIRTRKRRHKRRLPEAHEVEVHVADIKCRRARCNDLTPSLLLRHSIDACLMGGLALAVLHV
jgi:hypothetical protein